MGVTATSDAGDPCPVELLALRRPGDPVLLRALEDLRRVLETDPGGRSG